METNQHSIENSRYRVRAASLYGVDVLLKQFNLNVESTFGRVGLSSSLLENKETSIEYEKFLNLINVCAESSDRDDFGVLLSEHQDIKILGALGLAMKEAPTLRAAIENLIGFLHVHMNGLMISLTEENNQALLSFQVTLPFAPDYRQQIDLAISIGVRFIRRFFGTVWAPLRVYVEYEKDAASQTLGRLCQCPISFSQEINCYTFRADVLDEKRDVANEELHLILCDYLRLRTDKMDNDFIMQVHERIVTSLQNGLCSIDHISGSMGMNRRTFQRRMDSKGLKFKIVLEQTRMDLAQRYLRITPIPITQISDMLCYSDLASFSRSFRRYFGKAPSYWRQDLLAS